MKKARSGVAHNNVVLTLVERGARSFHIDSTRIADIAPIARENIKPRSTYRKPN